MADLNWPQIFISLATGGLAVQLVRMGWEHWTTRRQPVGYHITTDAMFSSAPHADSLQAQANVTFEGQSYVFDSLSLVRVDIKNNGNKDLDSFTFGVTLNGGHKAVRARALGNDRHHTVQESDAPATPANEKDSLDFVCKPFHRRDEYSVSIYVRNSGTIARGQVKISSPEPIQLQCVHNADEVGANAIVLRYLIHFSTAIGVAVFAIALKEFWPSPTVAPKNVTDEIFDLKDGTRLQLVNPQAGHYFILPPFKGGQSFGTGPQPSGTVFNNGLLPE